MKLHDFYALVKQAVINHDELRTFCVISEPNDITKDNLARTIHDLRKPFFYSKDWVESGYDESQVRFSNPSLFIYEKPFVIKELFSGRDMVKYQLQFLVLLDDHNYQVGADIVPDTQRLETVEIFAKATEILLGIFNYIYAGYPKFRVFNTELIVSQWQTSGMLMAGVSCDITFIQPCPEILTYWDVEVEQPVSNYGCNNYIKLVNGVYTITIPASEHKLSKVSGAKIYDSSGDELEMCVNVNQSTKTVIVESNKIFDNFNVVIFA